MKLKKMMRAFALLTAVTLFMTSCGSDDEASVGTGNCDSVDSVTLQLQWFAQAQFAGYYAAEDGGIYDNYCLDVTIMEGGVDIVPQQQLASGAADFAVSWVPKVLVSNEQGMNLVNVAQVFQRSGTLQVSWADSGINSPADMAGKTVGNWGWGNEFELLAGARQAGLDPATDFNLVQQGFDMLGLLEGEMDAVQAMIYNEYAQVLEAINPATGELYTADDMTVIDWNDEGTAMLQDAIWADGDRLASDEAYQDITTRFVAASLEGWAHCRDHSDECVEHVLNNGSALGTSHQTWQMNEINALIWPSPDGVGMIDADQWAQTIDVVTNYGDLEAVPAEDAYTNEYAEAANDILDSKGISTTGSDWTRATVILNEGGE